jgi:hypothetical protein
VDGSADQENPHYPHPINIAHNFTRKAPSKNLRNWRDVNLPHPNPFSRQDTPAEPEKLGEPVAGWKKATREGIPSSIRGDVWMHFLNTRAAIMQFPSKYQV